jgi:hypothetical protein
MGFHRSGYLFLVSPFAGDFLRDLAISVEHRMKLITKFCARVLFSANSVSLERSSVHHVAPCERLHAFGQRSAAVPNLFWLAECARQENDKTNEKNGCVG